MSERAVVAVLSAALLFATSAPCHAGAADAESKSRSLFAEADELVSHGQLGEACPLFKAAHELHATGGTALRTADCYEKVGKLDLALLHYQYIVDHRATDKEPARVALAEARVASLTKELAVAQAPPPVAAPPPPAPPPPKPNRLPAFVAFGAGGAGVVVAALFGGLALAQAGDVKAKCGGAPPCMPKAPDTTASLEGEAGAAKTKAWVSNVGIFVAIAGAATGAVLYLLELPKAQAAVTDAVARGATFRF